MGGYVILPRCLDKGRALLAGTVGEYHFACPVDKTFFDFVGIEGDGLKAQLATGKGDGEVLEWIEKNARNKRAAWEISAWSHYQENEGPGDSDFRDFFNKLHRAANPKREDIYSLFDLLELDDYVSYGGKG